MSDSRPGHVRLGVGIGGAGRHPAAWREPTARPHDLFAAQYTIELVQRAESAKLDFVTLEDSFALQPAGEGTERGRLDALLTLARVAPVTRAIGLVPEVTTTHTEPFHVSKNLATLDFVSTGRAGWRVGVSTTDGEAAHFGRKPAAGADELFAEAEETVDVVRRLWDSWEDDAVVRDRATGRYVDRDKLHYVDFDGRFFSVRGPSITPRPPQGHPVVAVDATSDPALSIAGRYADLVFVDARDAGAAKARRATVRDRVAAAGRDPDSVAVLANVDAVLDTDDGAARALRERLNAHVPVTSTTLEYVGSALGLATLIDAWFTEGAVDGFHLRPATLPRGLDLIADELVPTLCELGRFRSDYAGSTLRDHLGLVRPPNRYERIA